MHFKRHEKEIIKKIASGEVRDIPSYLEVFKLNTFYRLDKKEIEKKLETTEGGKTYKKLKSCESLFNYGTTYLQNPIEMTNSVPQISSVVHGDEDYEYIPAKLQYKESSYTVDVDEKNSYTYDFFKGINVANSFSDIKMFLTIWQFLKSEGLVLEVDKETSSKDYEPFFDFKPIEETSYYMDKVKKAQNVGKPDLIPLLSGNMTLGKYIDRNAIKDYRDYVDSLFEYNISHERICSQFINKQIYGNSELDFFIKKGFKTTEQINVKRALIPAYLALVLTLVIAIWQQLSVDNSDLVKIQNQIEEIQTIIDDKNEPDLSQIEKDLKIIIEEVSSLDGGE